MKKLYAGLLLAVYAHSLQAADEPDLNMECKVTVKFIQGGGPTYRSRFYQGIKKFTFDQQYAPLNISADGSSLNEMLLSADLDPAEVKERSQQWIKVTRSSNGSISADIENDWDEDYVRVSLDKVKDKYKGYVHIIEAHGPQHLFNIICNDR